MGLHSSPEPLATGREGAFPLGPEHGLGWRSRAGSGGLVLKWGWSERSPDVIWERAASVPFLHTQGLDGVGGYLRVPLILVSHPQSIPVVTIRVRTRVSVSASASTATSVTVLTRATRAPTAPSVSYASGPSLLLLWVFLYTRHLPSFLEMASFACLPSTLLKHGFHGALFLVRPLCGSSSPCSLSPVLILGPGSFVCHHS